ncbi:hypothetical protein P5673_027753 [Acropora cervicornis]|uniref:Uncharacterized protein n=1 Tax=Acropora cervicornis TaxID=6130 RepID=A0AAD9PYE2_ACRCE|nr:hypothetical protein P5673_027753 [Acropora cervicornis]
MDAFYAKLCKYSSKPIALSLIPKYADSYILKSHCVPTSSNLFNKKYLDLCYPELLKACHEGISNIPVQQQMNASDCGVYATCLVYGQNP